MILTGDEIIRMRNDGDIIIEPFFKSQINPNSYNYRLGSKLGFYKDNGEFEFMDIPEDGIILDPQTMYLGHTLEVLGSDRFAMSLIGRSSLGRLGLFLQVSANLGHTGSCHQWTLELVCAKKIRLYPNMIIGQISFWHNDSVNENLYKEGYSSYNMPMTSCLEV